MTLQRHLSLIDCGFISAQLQAIKSFRLQKKAGSLVSPTCGSCACDSALRRDTKQRMCCLSVRAFCSFLFFSPHSISAVREVPARRRRIHFSPSRLSQRGCLSPPRQAGASAWVRPTSSTAGGCSWWCARCRASPQWWRSLLCPRALASTWR